MANFKTRARSVDLLGKQQIRDEVTAISELLRNSYDADASEALVDISTEDKRIVVWDDGDGMTERELQENWLTLGTFSKFGSGNKKTCKGRIKIGEKGIGRLAISLLGDQLLLLSKRRGDGKWALLYLHWELFRNEKMFLEDIEIPIKSFSNINDLEKFLKNDFNSLKQILISNMDDAEKWSSNVSNQVKNDITQFNVTDEVIGRLRINEKKGQGTLFYINNLERNWDWSIYKSKIEDESLKRRSQRLKDVLFSFTNLIDLFDEGKELSNDENSFLPKIHIDGYRLENETWFNPDDVQLFDYALKGKIENGSFTGHASIHNPKGIEVIDVNGISLTQGMYKSSYYDCGPIKVKWFFIEGKDSSLTKEQHEMMNKKLGSMGGIYVFRDGLRILPYGEPGNDFLHMEERRSKGATYYLFSHRRMYGYMEISKSQNPNLIDKSSREGFVENNEFNYFRTVAINLLIWWAHDLLETNTKGGRRDLHIKRSQQVHEAQQRLLQKQREEEKREKEYFKELQRLLLSFDSRLKQINNEVRQEIDYILAKKNLFLADILKNKIGINELIFDLKNAMLKLVNRVDTLRIDYNPRFQYDNNISDVIDQSNNKIDRTRMDLTEYIDISTNELSNILLDGLRDKDRIGSINARLIQAINWINEVLPSKLSEIQSTGLKNINQSLNFALEQVYSRINDEVLKERSKFNEVLKNLQHQSNKLKSIFDELQNNLFSLNNGAILDEAEVLLANFQNNVEVIEHSIMQFDRNIQHSGTLEFVNRLIDYINAEMKGKNHWKSDDAFIGLLKKEVGVYRDLSAVGLAAELTSHEFNALYKTIQENINILHRALKTTKVLPFLEKTRQAFVALERLHQRMSPLYRQTRYRRKDIRLNEFVATVFEYFCSDIERYNIQTINDIPENAIIKETESVLFTPLINLLANSIYWLLDRDIREIYYYTSPGLDRLYIHDTGPGIGHKDRERIFEPFFSRKVEGRGLGLFLSKDILESKGHSLILVEPGQEPRPLGGACFCIQFSHEAVNEVTQ